ncbi:hypothetical protein GTA08_BOTSDO14358 [Botryosphaeria dothidea]|uniref:Semialdehyde dehydrogenase NAD-binding domain-containing protein n=1 Tax=Botryosphaeria dothidea TaxID=55169 RepID=A0A8H4J7K9_9PEZI|nr:hypothetical protein GTA08_BOTSDO14358 [Botryosphaeria dothidea]
MGRRAPPALRIHEYLAQRSDVELLRIDPDKRKDPAERARLLNAADVAFLCLPDAAAREAAAMVTNPNTCLIDASTAHRIDPSWAFGLPELSRGQRGQTAPEQANRQSGLPRQRLHPAGAPAGGRRHRAGGAAAYQAGGDDKLLSPRPYGLTLAHKHIPEMMTHTGLTTKPVFLPIVGNFYKGLAVSLPLHFEQLAPGTDAQRLQAALEAHYEGERFVKVMPLRDAATLEAGFFDVQATNDTNDVELFVFAHDTQAVLIARLDNLGKGASGAGRAVHERAPGPGRSPRLVMEHPVP